MKQPIRLGPLALILTVISICLSVLGVLTLTASQADLRVAQKYADTVTNNYALEAQGQAWLAEAAADPAALTPDADGLVHTEIEGGNSMLSIALFVDGDSVTIQQWKLTHEWQAQNVELNLWPGLS